jgi:hypothetical protein
MLFRTEERGGKVYIQVLDIDDRLEIISWEVVVDKNDLMLCIRRKENAGAEDPVFSAMLDFAYSGVCT